MGGLCGKKKTATTDAPPCFFSLSLSPRLRHGEASLPPAGALGGGGCAGGGLPLPSPSHAKRSAGWWCLSQPLLLSTLSLSLSPPAPASRLHSSGRRRRRQSLHLPPYAFILDSSRARRDSGVPHPAPMARDCVTSSRSLAPSSRWLGATVSAATAYCKSCEVVCV